MSSRPNVPALKVLPNRKDGRDEEGDQGRHHGCVNGQVICLVSAETFAQWTVKKICTLVEGTVSAPVTSETLRLTQIMTTTKQQNSAITSLSPKMK